MNYLSCISNKLLINNFIMGGCFSENEGPKNGERTGSKKNAPKMTEQQLKTAIDKIFDEYDKDNSGALDKHEVSILLTKSLGRDNLT